MGHWGDAGEAIKVGSIKVGVLRGLSWKWGIGDIAGEAIKVGAHKSRGPEKPVMGMGPWGYCRRGHKSRGP